MCWLLLVSRAGGVLANNINIGVQGDYSYSAFQIIERNVIILFLSQNISEMQITMREKFLSKEKETFSFHRYLYITTVIEIV